MIKTRLLIKVLEQFDERPMNAKGSGVNMSKGKETLCA